MNSLTLDATLTRAEISNQIHNTLTSEVSFLRPLIDVILDLFRGGLFNFGPEIKVFLEYPHLVATSTTSRWRLPYSMITFKVLNGVSIVLVQEEVRIVSVAAEGRPACILCWGHYPKAHIFHARAHARNLEELLLLRLFLF
jgi:hypothetical protein